MRQMTTRSEMVDPIEISDEDKSIGSDTDSHSQKCCPFDLNEVAELMREKIAAPVPVDSRVIMKKPSRI